MSHETKSDLKIETLEGYEGSEVSFCPQRGGIITSMKLKGREVLYLDSDTFRDTSINVKGGIPILFPNAGPLEGGPYPLKQHGFARTSDKWSVDKIKEGESNEKFMADEDTKKSFPYNFLLEMKTKMENDGSITLAEETTNLEKDKDMPVSMGLHPYFRVSEEKKKEVELYVNDKKIETNFEKWSKGEAVSIDNPKLENPDAIFRVAIPDLGTIAMNASLEYKKIWIWTQPGKDFICVEPVMRDAGGLVNDPELIKPEQTLSAKVNFRLE